MYSTDTCSRWIQTSWWSIHSTRTSGTRFPTLTTAVPTQISPQTIGSWSSGELVLLHWLLQINIKLSLSDTIIQRFFMYSHNISVIIFSGRFSTWQRKCWLSPSCTCPSTPVCYVSSITITEKRSLVSSRKSPLMSTRKTGSVNQWALK